MSSRSSILTTLVYLTLLAQCTTAFFRPRSDDEGDDPVLSVPIRNWGNQAYSVHVQMGATQWFNFSLSTTLAYTAVAGPGCSTCTTASNHPLYNPANSSTYVPPTTNATFKYNGVAISGGLATENCAFKEQNGTWWEYNNQKIVVAGNDSSAGAFQSSLGIAGLGQSGVPVPQDGIIGQYLASDSDSDEGFSFGMAVYGSASAIPVPSGNTLSGDSSGGFLHINGPDDAFYSDSISSIPVASTQVTGGFGAVPNQLGSYDWTIQMQEWLLKTSSGTTTGSQGVYATLEVGYPYILLPQADAQKLYAAIPGATSFSVSPSTTTSSGQAIYQDNLALAWSVPCTLTGVALYIDFSGKSIPIQPEDFVTSIGGQICIGNVMGWADPTQSTAILGSSFFRSAYIVFTAYTNPAQNTIGLANRIITSSGKNSSNKNVIIGAVVGAVVFVVIVCVLVFLLVRRQRNRSRFPPSAAFTGQTHRRTTDDSVEKSNNLNLLSFGSHGREVNDPKYAAEPWIPPSENPGDVIVQPWTPTAASDQAFLSPTGTAYELAYSPPPGTMSSHTAYSGPSPTTGTHQRPASVATSFATSSQPPTSPAPYSAVSPPPPGATAAVSPSYPSHGAVRPLPRPPGGR